MSSCFNATASTRRPPLSLPDALPISANVIRGYVHGGLLRFGGQAIEDADHIDDGSMACPPNRSRSEEHTSEPQSHHDLVCRLLLAKKKKNTGRSVFGTDSRGRVGPRM